jgi:ubiquinone/menaquinone biosynthesis C-methylase UbiE
MMMHIGERARVENETGDLYADCFSLFTDDQWIAQGDLLADQLGLDGSKVRGTRCFDGGCGHGALVYRLAKLGAAEIVGFDLKPNPKIGMFVDVPQASFIQGSLLEIPFPDASFDLVVSSGVLHHTVDPDRVFAELTRILKPGGGLVIGLYGKHGFFPWCLSIARVFTVRVPVIPKRFIRKVCAWLCLDAIWRYQVLDYLYVPILHRYAPHEIASRFFGRHGFEDVHRISNLTPEKASGYVRRNASYTYDHRSFASRILFGHGFIVTAGRKR